MTNDEVCKAWSEGKSGHSLNMTSNGNTLFSFALPIGYTKRNGEKVVIDFTGNGFMSFSQTTSRHVGYARRYVKNVLTKGSTTKVEVHGYSVLLTNRGHETYLPRLAAA